MGFDIVAEEDLEIGNGFLIKDYKMEKSFNYFMMISCLKSNPFNSLSENTAFLILVFDGSIV
jgi:hypothetical protein